MNPSLEAASKGRLTEEKNLNKRRLGKRVVTVLLLQLLPLLVYAVLSCAGRRNRIQALEPESKDSQGPSTF